MGITPLQVTPMLLASRALIRQHREVSAVLLTYAAFMAALLLLAWSIALE